MDLVRRPGDLEVSNRRRVWVGHGDELEGYLALRIGLAVGALFNVAGVFHLLGVLIFAGCVRVRLVGKGGRGTRDEGVVE